VKDDRTTATAAIILDDEEDSQQGDKAFLVVYSGQGRSARTRVVSLPDGVKVSIGRLESSTVRIDHELVSRRHARVTRRGAEIVVEDMGSRNGTRVNGVAIEGPTRVSTGDELVIGPASAIVGVTSGMRRRTLVASTAELEERLEAELDRATRYHRPLGLTMLRLDGQREATSAAIERVGRSLRRMDYLAEYGPEEYAILLPEANRAAAEAAAERLVREAHFAGSTHGPVAVHIGLAVCPDDGTQSGVLVSRARAALRAARTGGRGISAAPEEELPLPQNTVVVDPLMKRVLTLARKVAETPITVLVVGETGSGKEIVANAIHQASPRAAGPFQAINCSALSETLLESELFGHERGAFTGADRRKLGHFEVAQSGTIFLDEVGEMPPGLQAKLLRVLEQRTITRVGSTAQVAIDVRIVCATNRDLESEIKRGRFREDLYFRMSAFTLVVPPLRDRPSEILPLAGHFARQFALELGQAPPRFSREARDLLESHDWPGNVRELRNAIERAVVLQPSGIIGADHLPDRVLAGARVAAASERARTEPVAPPADVRQQVASVERAAVIAALQTCRGNQTHAARQLGISRYALIRLMRKYEIAGKPR